MSSTGKKPASEQKDDAGGLPKKLPKCVTVVPGQFEPEAHHYTKVLNANIHPMVSFFFNLSTNRIVERYCHLNPTVDKETLLRLFRTKPEHFRWAGADLFYATNEDGNRQMVLIETNSCPSGQKSMPYLNEHDEAGGYRALLERTLIPAMEEANIDKSLGGVAVVYDKNVMEASGYACVLADLLDEEVYLIEYYETDKDPNVRWTQDLIMEVRPTMESTDWIPIRVAFRYVTQRPWSRFPIEPTRTLVLNPVIACVAGGRNKLIAAKAYEFFNAKIAEAGLEIMVPETVSNVSFSEIPLIVAMFGGHAVVKVPYSNAGQGVFTITTPEELDNLMAHDFGDNGYEQFVVQGLIGGYTWSSKSSRSGQLYHVGTIPDKNGNIYVADIRMMIHFDYKKNAWCPLVLYSRRAERSLNSKGTGPSTWDILGTNLSYKTDNGLWATDTNRLYIMDRRDFNRLGIGTDDLIQAFVQTVLASLAIDDMSQELLKDDRFNDDLFFSLNKDEQLNNEFLDSVTEGPLMTRGERLAQKAAEAAEATTPTTPTA